jgi:PAT family beta-lactamase induction signal transducer AmpG
MPSAQSFKESLLLLFSSRRMLVMVLFGFSSGLPFALTAGTLQAWLADEGLSIQTIGWLTLVGQPYFYKFLWAPLMDRFSPPFLSQLMGKRRSWILYTQIGIVIAVLIMAWMNPAQDPWLLAIVAIAVAFISASQDLIIDAYRTEILTPEERGAGTSLFVTSWRVAAIVSGAGALILADQWGWMVTYTVMALLMLIGVFGTWLAHEPGITKTLSRRTLRDAIVLPLQDFWQRDHACWLLLLVVLYKFADAFALQLMTAFFTVGGGDVPGLGFTKTEIGLIGKGWGLFATLLGFSVAGIVMVRLRLFWALLIFGCLQIGTNLMFAWLAIVGKNYSLLVATVFMEHFTSALGTTAFLTLLMSICNPHFAVTQYAVLSALSSIGVRFLGPVAGYMVAALGWAEFFIWSFIAGIPSIALIIFMRKILAKYDNRDTVEK